MAVSFLLLIIITAGGLAMTYLIETEEPLIWRLAAGNVIGCAVFGTVLFLVACAFGLGLATVSVSLIITLLPLALFVRRENLNSLRSDWQRAKGKLQGANARKFLIFSYYLFFFLVIWLFFDRAMFYLPDGIYTGASHNLGDLPFHLGAVFSFTDGSNFPPQNPSFAGAKFSYPFMADVVAAGLLKFGANVRAAMFASNLSWSLALLILLDRFVARVAAEWSAGKIAPFLLFFSGGLGFLWFFNDFAMQASGFWDFLWHLPCDYTIDDKFSWGNSLVTLFITQRSLLFGMPLTLAVLSFLWKAFNEEDKKGIAVNEAINWRALWTGLIAGFLPLIHLHSLAVLFVVTVFLFVFRPEKWRTWVTFGGGVCVIAIPELAWSIIGSASKAASFIGWHFGWDVKDENVFWFWFRNTGLVIPLLIGGILVAYFKKGHSEPRAGRLHDGHSTSDESRRNMLLFYLPFLFCYVIANITKLAPWEWDNVKVLIYWFVGSLPFITVALIWVWRRNTIAKIGAGVCFATLVAAGSLDVWRTISDQTNIKVFDKGAEQIAERITKTAPVHALFLNAPTYNTAVVLSGRLSLIRFPGHLWSHGIDYGPREDDVKRMYGGGPGADDLLRQYGVDYVLISPEERNSLKVNEEYFRKFPVAAEVGQYRVYKTR